MKGQLTTSTASPLTPAPTEKVREAVVKLFAAYNITRPHASITESAVATWVAVLSEYPTIAITRAALAFLSGRVNGYNRSFPPTISEMAFETRRQRDEMRAAMVQPKAIEPPAPARTDDERAAISRQFDEMLAGMLGKKKQPDSEKQLAPGSEGDTVANEDSAQIEASPHLVAALNRG